MTASTKGLLAMALACTTWGLSPLYYAQLTHIPPLEILSYRSLWSLVFFVIILAVQGRLIEVPAAIKTPRSFLIVAAAAVMISGNWFGFIYAVSTGQGMEAALGYYIFPLVAVLFGRVLFAEVLTRWQWAAVSLAALAVLILATGLGVAPWIAFWLAATFSVYGVIKKQLGVGPVVSVTAEVLILAPIAIGWLAYTGTGAQQNIGTHLLLALSGPLTATPLILFSYAARNARMSSVGLVQYLNPTLQFLCAVLVLGEVFTPWHGIAFPLIWTALAIYSIAALRQDRLARRAAVSASTSSTIVT